MNESPHRLILASAGTGKTFQLTGHFLRLLVAGRSPERILATTFTRKAAGEILDRVLTRLVAATESEDERRLIEAPDLDAATAERLLEKLARRLDRFRVRTLDAFFVQIAQVFAFELELPPVWRIVDTVEDRRLQTAALGRTLTAAPVAERVELLRGIQSAGAPRAVADAALDVIGRAREAFLDSRPEAWHRAVPPGLLDRSGLVVARAALEQELGSGNSGRAWSKRWANGCRKIADGVESGEWQAVLASTLASACVTPDGTYYGAPVPEGLRAVLRPLVDHAVATGVAEIDRRDRSAFAFLERFEATYRELKRERGAYRFQDLPLALTPAGGVAALDERLADLWFRLDGRVDDLLLDEFQDTAPIQWRALEPLATEVLTDSERTFFCVGDVKQSIYGWRAAEPRLLARLPERYPQLATERLNVSHRSAAVVLDAVDQLFEGVGDAESFRDQPAFRDAAAEFLVGYQRHEAAHPAMPGDAVVVEVPLDGDVPKEQRRSRVVSALIARAAERVGAIVDAAPHATVGVLTRRRKRIPALIHALRERGVRASGEGGNPLTDAESVQVVLSAFHLADHPDDTVAAFHVATSPLSGAIGLSPEASTARRREVSARLRMRLVQEGFGATVTMFAERIQNDPAWSDWDRRRVRQLIDLGLQFDARPSLRPSDFADLVRATPVEDPEGAGVRVMTIHASKGLEFDAVVLPELDGQLVSNVFRGPVRTRRDDPYGPLDEVSLGLKKELRSFVPALEELQLASEVRQTVDALCTLYVATTRAARRVEFVVPPDIDCRKGSFARLLRDRFDCRAPGPDGVVWRHPRGSDAWAEGIEAAPKAPPVRRLPGTWTLRPSPRPRSLRRRTPSGEERVDASASVLLASRNRAAAHRGILAHRLFEEVEWIEEFQRSDDQLVQLLAATEPDVGSRHAAVADFRAALRLKEIRELLTRPRLAAGTELEVLRERDFTAVVPDEQGAEELWTGAIDRLVLHRAGGNVIVAEVVDFKSDAVTSDGLPARVERYRPQVEAYRHVVAAITGLPRRSIRARLAFVSAGFVVSV